ncbi:MAG: ABC transporter permease [Armatimonadota bacterium]
MTDLLLMRATLREAFRPRRLVIALLLTLLPAAIGLLWRLLAPKDGFNPAEVYDSLVVGLIFSFALTILSVTYGTGVVSQEIEQRTIVYLLTRPLPRWRLLLARFLVSVLVVTAVCVLATVLLALTVFGPAEFGAAEVGPDLKALILGSVAYGSLFLLLGTALPKPLTWGLIFVFGWETWVPKLPGSFALLSVMSYLRALAAREISVNPAENAGDNLLLAFSRAPQVTISPSVAWTTLLLLSAVCTVTAMIVFSRKEYVPREDAE